MTTDTLTHDQALEKAEWIDKLRELGFVWDSNIDDQPDLSEWRHKNIGHLTARLALVTDGHFAAMICIGLSHVMRPDIHLGAGTPEELQQIYDVVTENVDTDSTEEES
nr:MAG TPA: hypothetical protein [Caudoviricetes sp.]